MSAVESIVSGAARAREPLRIEWRADPAAMESVREEWRRLEHQSAGRTIFSNSEYALPWYRAYGGIRGRPRLGLAWEGPQLVGVAPLVSWNGTLGRVPVRRVDFVGHNWDGGEFLVADGRADVVDAFLGSLRAVEACDVFCVGSLIPDGFLDGAVRDAARSRRMPMERDDYRYAAADLRDGYAAFVASRGPKYRREVTRHTKHIQRAGKPVIEFAWDLPDDAAAEAAMARMIAITDHSWKAKAEGPMAGPHRRFFTEMAVEFRRRGKLALTFLTLDGRDVAYILAVRDGETFYDIAISFDEALRPHYPGMYMMMQILEALPARGVRAVVSHGDHPYKKRWASGFPTLSRRFLFAPSVRGRFSRAARFTLPRIWSNVRHRRRG